MFTWRSTCVWFCWGWNVPWCSRPQRPGWARRQRSQSCEDESRKAGPEKDFCILSIKSALKCIMAGKYLHYVGSHHLKASDDFILCGRYELEGQQNENHANKTNEPLACAEQPGGHRPVTEERRRSAITFVWGDVLKLKLGHLSTLCVTSIPIRAVGSPATAPQARGSE